MVCTSVQKSIIEGFEGMRRFYADPVALNRTPVLLDPEESHHLAKVLRLQRGDVIELFDGSGALYTGSIEQLGTQVAVGLVSKVEPRVERQSGSVILCQGDLKGGKMDFLVEKCTELGVERFISFSADRSQGRLNTSRLAQRRKRRMSIVKKACKQSGRLRFMQIDEEVGLGKLLEIDFGPGHRKLMLWEKAKDTKLAEKIGGRTDDQVCLMIGPEGGFSDEEAVLAQSFGWQPVSLGNQILRAETAAISAVVITNHLLGRM